MIQKISYNRPWECACAIGWIVFIIFQTKHGYSRHMCSPSLYNEVFKGYYLYADFTVSGGFGIIWIILLSRIILSKRKLHEISSYVAFFHVVSMGLCSSLLSLASDRGGICADYFG